MILIIQKNVSFYLLTDPPSLHGARCDCEKVVLFDGSLLRRYRLRQISSHSENFNLTGNNFEFLVFTILSFSLFKFFLEGEKTSYDVRVLLCKVSSPGEWSQLLQNRFSPRSRLEDKTFRSTDILCSQSIYVWIYWDFLNVNSLQLHNDVLSFLSLKSADESKIFHQLHWRLFEAKNIKKS